MAQPDSTPSTIDDFFLHCTELVFIASEGGALLRMSRALTRAVSPELLHTASQAGLAPLVHPDDRRAFDEAWTRLRAAAEPVLIDVRLKTADGSFKFFQCAARWVPEKREVYGTLRDAEERIKQEIQIKLLKAINDHLPICLWAIDERGVFVLHDGKGLAAAGLDPGQFVGLNIFEIYPESGTAELRKALEGKMSYFMNELKGVHWEAWYLPIQNERGDVTHVAGITLDITATRRTEHELRAKLELIERQQQVIRSLSTPIIQVWDRVLTLPLVGMFDSVRAADVMEGVLREVVRTRARYAILDLTGIEAMDTETANHLLKLTGAIKLLGAEGIITGIHPAIAQTIVGLGVDLTSIETRSTLRQGLEHCIRRMAGASRRLGQG
ncbi:anti-anti-sigma factor [Sorangium cellulosum]|uniref:Anti-anti-sigma factor n=1 Tax=Sorangium cellulosum TaxID=56 RepID=A0A2L0FA68_SORCE|nr:STAS domain-containing protein [Sorangium cellulosum]AUX48411.1 anti-anti-sigma factor [Sorangium cellulosum]